MPTPTFLEIFNGLFFRLNMHTNLKFVALPVPEIIGGTKKNWEVPGYAHAPFTPKFLMGFCSDGPCQWLLPSLKSVASSVPEIIAIGVLGGAANPESWGKGGHRGSGMVPFKRALTMALRCNFSSIFTRFRDIAAFVLQHATFPHPTSSLRQIYPCSPRIRWMFFGLRRVKVLV